MATRIYRPKDNHVTVKTEMVAPHANTIATDLLIPRIAEINHHAVDVVPTPVYFFNRIRAGRRCSCYSNESSPMSLCRACWGTGIVGGYNKYGTNLVVLDVTYPNVRSMNIIPSYETNQKPRKFALIDGTVEGFVEARLPLETNIGILDHIFTDGDYDGASSITALLKAPGDTDYVEFTTAALTQRLFNPHVDVKFILKRGSCWAKSPTFGLLYIRYQRKTEMVVNTNTARNQNSIALQELGVVDDWRTQKFWTDNTIRSVSTEDFMAEQNRNIRWKIVSVNEFAPENLLLSWDFEARLVQNYEPLNFLPI